MSQFLRSRRLWHLYLALFALLSLGIRGLDTQSRAWIDSPALPADFDQACPTWRLTLPVTEANSTIHQNNNVEEQPIVSLEQREALGSVSPLTPILLVSQGEQLPLVETALGGNMLPNQMYVVPAIFLKYRSDKIRNDYIEKGVVTTLDIATIALSGGTALATKVHWVQRAWALAEVAGAVGNIAVNTQTVSQPELKELVDTYNLAMGLIGIKNAGLAGYKFAKGLPSETKKLLEKGGELRQMLAQRYQTWKAQRAKLSHNLSVAEQQLLTQQEKAWEILGLIENSHGGGVMPGQARKIAIERFGREAEELITIKFKENGGAVAEIIAYFGEEGMRALRGSSTFKEIARNLASGRTAYRYISSDVKYLEVLKRTGIIPKQHGHSQTYSTLEKIDSPTSAIDILQLTHSDAIWRAEFTTNQLGKNISFPKAKWNNQEYFEVITRSYPSYGRGGGSQFITQEEIRLSKLINLETGEEILFSPE